MRCAKNSIIDKTYVEINIANLDKEVLLNSGIDIWTKKNATFESEFMGEDEVEYQVLTIKKNDYFDRAKISAAKDTIILQFSVDNKKSGNLVPMTLSELKTKVNEACEFLSEKYGIYLAEETARIKKMELNRTFETKYKFYEYERAIRYLMSIMPSTWNNKKYWDFRSKEGKLESTYKISGAKEHRGLQLKFYDKSTQLKEVKDIEINKNIMRVEIPVANTVFNTLFDTKKLYLADTTEDVLEKVMSDFMIENFVEPFYKDKQERVKELKKSLKECRKKGKEFAYIFYTKLLMDDIKNYHFLLLDISEIEELINSVKFETPIEKSRTKKKLIEVGKKLQYFDNKDYEKVVEILENLSGFTIK